MPDIYLYAGEPNPNDIRLRDPTILVGGGTDATALPNVVAATFTLQVSTVSGDGNTSSGIQSAVFMTQAATLTADASITTSVLSATFSVQPAVATGDTGAVDGTALPNVVSATWSVLPVDADGSSPYVPDPRRNISHTIHSTHWVQPRKKRNRRKADEEALVVGGAL